MKRCFPAHISYCFLIGVWTIVQYDRFVHCTIGRTVNYYFCAWAWAAIGGRIRPLTKTFRRHDNKWLVHVRSSEHVRSCAIIITSCIHKTLYALRLRVLRAHSTCDTALQSIYRSVVNSQTAVFVFCLRWGLRQPRTSSGLMHGSLVLIVLYWPERLIILGWFPSRRWLPIQVLTRQCTGSCWSQIQHHNHYTVKWIYCNVIT